MRRKKKTTIIPWIPFLGHSQLIPFQKPFCWNLDPPLNSTRMEFLFGWGTSQILFMEFQDSAGFQPESVEDNKDLPFISIYFILPSLVLSGPELMSTLSLLQV